MLFFPLLIKNLIEVSLIYIIALVSGVEHSESVVLFVCILQIILHDRLLQDISYNSLDYIVEPYCLFISCIIVRIC